jgi:hypothetical protein
MIVSFRAGRSESPAGAAKPSADTNATHAGHDRDRQAARGPQSHPTGHFATGEVPFLTGAHFATSTFPAVLSIWMIQNASASSCMIMATTPVPGAKK